MQRGQTRSRRQRWSAALWPLAAIAIPLGSLVLTGGWPWRGLQERSTLEQASFHTRLLVTEAALVSAVAPLAGIVIVRRARRRLREHVSPSPRPAILSAMRPLAVPVIVGVTVMGAASALMSIGLRTPLTAGELWASRAILCAAAFALTAVGAMCAAVLQDVLDSAACAAGIAAAAALAVFAAGPLLGEVPEWVLQAVLFVSPIVTAAASANVDIFRTEVLYQISPLAHIQFSYPATMAAFTGYLLTACLLLCGAARQVSRTPGAFSRERTSA